MKQETPLHHEITGWSITRSGHILPNNDLRSHTEADNCWCSPTKDDGVVIHHSADGREAFESGERKTS